MGGVAHFGCHAIDAGKIVIFGGVKYKENYTQNKTLTVNLSDLTYRVGQEMPYSTGIYHEVLPFDREFYTIGQISMPNSKKQLLFKFDISPRIWNVEWYSGTKVSNTYVVSPTSNFIRESSGYTGGLR
eukprot:TRINITY_DN17138_c0_g1_i1.p1 TRINITY_DN17138_c0_g1~~TRINITY_DN17138_c0_g1_i1.p1  ORF type:complete len:128 (+),score=8.24 TRINITY_DN17138_c0_g1_i1:65-448(+)